MITNFKIFESVNENIIPSQGKLDVSSRKITTFSSRSLDANNYVIDKLNDYLISYRIRNEEWKSYYDIYITDKDLNILFGESRDKDKFNYKLFFDGNFIHDCIIFQDNKTSKYGLVDETGKNVLVQPEYGHIGLYDGYWRMTTGEDPILEPDETAIANRKGKILMEKNNFFHRVSKQTITINGKWEDVILYNIKGEKEYKKMSIDEFFNTDWEIKLASDKYNL